MNEIRNLNPYNVWNFFADICNIPHPTGHTQNIAAYLIAQAHQRHLQVRQDAAGNLRIDRLASLGYENCPHVILQGHLDMVPQKAPGKIFDFEHDPIAPRIIGERIQADRTTLGADDGIAIINAMAALSEPELICGPLSALFTIDEETGMHGAKQLDPTFLEGDMLINIDHGEEGVFIVGGAGGGVLNFSIPLGWQSPSYSAGVKIAVRGLLGGHSGAQIHRQRGNALIFLAQLAAKLPLEISDFSGGEVPNAISKDAQLTGAINISQSKIQQIADDLTEKLRTGFAAPDNFGFEVNVVPRPQRVWERAFQNSYLQSVITTPDGVFRRDEKLHVTALSSNLAVVQQFEEQLRILVHPRGLVASELNALYQQLTEHFADLGGTVALIDDYPTWPAKFDTQLVRQAVRCFQAELGYLPQVTVVNAGHETGLFCRLNPHLDLISLGPSHYDAHTPGESLDIKSEQRFYPFLLRLIHELAVSSPC